jgi:enoyl-CoA hydratase/carnithine racemase
MTMEDGLRTERLDGVMRVTFDRPRSANALNESLQRAFVAALRAAAADEAVRAVVLEGAGQKVFSAGADLKEYGDVAPMEAQTRRRTLLCDTLLTLLKFDKPVVAALHGKAVGAGCMVALLADEIHAGPDAAFSLPEVRIGMPTPLGATIAAARGGWPLARHLVLGGAWLDARQAQAWGLVTPVEQTAQVSEAALQRARELGQLDAYSYTTTKRWLNLGFVEELTRACAEAARLADTR